MERRNLTSVVLVVVVVTMLFAAGLFGYGIGYEHGSWDSAPNAVARTAQP